jgi:putative DNA primase/helicase
MRAASSPPVVVAAPPDLRELRLALIANWPALLRELLGKPTRRTARQWRWNRRGSLSAVMSGAKAGTWFDHEAGRGGGPFEIITRQRGGDWRDAADWGRAWLGMPAWEPARRAIVLAPAGDAVTSAAEPDPAAAWEGELRHHAHRAATITWERAAPADPAHGYLRRKGVQAHGIRMEQPGDVLVVPLIDLGGAIHTLQRIHEDGTKRFLSGGAEASHFAPIGGPLAGAATTLVCEGWATGATAHEATGLPVVAAMDAGNLKRVAPALRARFPDARLVILADNDAKPGRVDNPGVAAALATGALVAVPPEPGDFNDLAAERGIDAVRAAIAAAEPPPRPRPRPTYALAALELVAARALLDERIAEFMAEVAAYWTADPLEAELAPQPGPPVWAVLAAAEAAHGAACS